MRFLLLLKRSPGENEGGGGKPDPKPDDKKGGDEGDKKPDASGKQGNAGESDDTDLDDLDVEKLDPKAQALIKKLRKENADHRIKNKDLKSKVLSAAERDKALKQALGLESEEDKPEEKVKALTAETDALSFRNAVLEMALENGIAAQDVKYFEFLVTQKAGELKDDEELSDEQLAEIIADVKKRGGGQKKASTSVGNGGGEGKKDGSNPPPPGEDGEVNLDKFCKMTMAEKSALFGKNPELYKQLASEARRANRLI